MKSPRITWPAIVILLAATAAAQTRTQTRLKWEPLYEPGCGGWITSIAVSPHEARRVLVGGDMLGVGLSEDGGESWQSTFGFNMWEINDFTFHPTDPRIVWVGTLGGPYVSRDGGRNWQMQRTGFPPLGADHFTAPIEKVLFDPADTNRMLAFGGTHRGWPLVHGKPLLGVVWESRDGGDDWKQIATLGDGSHSANIVAAAFAAGRPDRLFAGVRGKGVYLSTDGGKTWNSRSDGLPGAGSLGRLVVHPSQCEVVWVSLGPYRTPGTDEFQPGGVYKSTDGGASWQLASNGLKLQAHKSRDQASDYKTLAVSPSNPDVLLTCDYSSWGRYEYKDVDGGQTLLFGPTTFKSTDGGKTWQPVLKHPAQNDGVYTAYPWPYSNTVIELAPHNAEIAFMGNAGSVLRTQDGGRNWIDATSYRPDPSRPAAWRGRGYCGICATNFAFNPWNPRHAVFQAGDYGEIWQSRDALTTWEKPAEDFMRRGLGGSAVTFAGENGRVMYVLIGKHNTPFGGIAKSVDAGRSWRLLAGEAIGLPEQSEHGQGNPSEQARSIHALPGDPNRVWATIGGRLYHSHDGGQVWRVVHNGPGLLWIAALPSEPSHFYVSSARGIYSTKDGEKFDLLPGSPGANPWNPGRLAVDGAKRPRLYAAGDGLWRLENGQWTQLRDDPAILDVAIDPTNPDRIAVATGDAPRRDRSIAGGVWISEDGGGTWLQQNDGLACLRGCVLAVNPHDPEQLVFGSVGRGFFVTRWPQR